MFDFTYNCNARYDYNSKKLLGAKIVYTTAIQWFADIRELFTTKDSEKIEYKLCKTSYNKRNIFFHFFPRHSLLFSNVFRFFYPYSGVHLIEENFTRVMYNEKIKLLNHIV